MTTADAADQGQASEFEDEELEEGLGEDQLADRLEEDLRKLV